MKLDHSTSLQSSQFAVLGIQRVGGPALPVHAAAMPHLHSPIAADRQVGTCREVEAVSYTYLRREWQILDQGVAGDFQQVCLPLSRVAQPDYAAHLSRAALCLP